MKRGASKSRVRIRGAQKREGLEMSAYAREYSVHVYLESPEGMSAAEFDIEMDFLCRTLGYAFEQDFCMDWWLWR